jgi:hypothetical protein
MDESPPLARVRRTTQARKSAETGARTARLEQLDAIVAAHKAGERQKDLVEITGLTRERLRQICKEPSGPYAEARQAITGDSWADDMARASISAAEAKFTPPAAADDDAPAKRRKPAHRCPTKGWCETCGEWKGGK